MTWDSHSWLWCRVKSRAVFEGTAFSAPAQGSCSPVMVCCSVAWHLLWWLLSECLHSCNNSTPLESASAPKSFLTHICLLFSGMMTAHIFSAIKLRLANHMKNRHTEITKAQRRPKTAHLQSRITQHWEVRRGCPGPWSLPFPDTWLDF